ncbi:GNAT family N-acetyltransferase [Dongshaea marina]|uniref:GNAT family N-acetyltransferase n=1 Tax=Dongshaea marina TaxID=2047966 RepID=UPI00131EFA4F|nr:GNAT family N-acetyltransferase [Dongshaea marina]
MKIKLRPLREDELEQAFAHYKASLYPFVEEHFGWDEEQQREHFFGEFQPQWFHWLESDDRDKGLVCMAHNPSGITLHLLVIFEDYREQGVAAEALNWIHRNLLTAQQSCTLSAFRDNKSAVSLYLRLGYLPIGQDGPFINLRWFKRENSCQNA